ncbi:MAG TPA: GTP-binding protein [Tepidisphaeraceae bacterium]|nr:GTP-binding protein [Tepidisphaeraceae bacterium]
MTSQFGQDGSGEGGKSRSGDFHPPAAGMIRKALTDACIPLVRIIGHPGSGKTELIEASLNHMAAPQRVAVIVINPASARDAQRLGKSCRCVAHIDAAVPTSSSVWSIIRDLKLEEFDMILIETAGGLAPLQDLGQDATVAVFAVSGGDDKAAEYHTLLNAASAVVLTKTDLRQLVKFDSQVFRNDLQSINPSAEVHELSAKTESGIGEWLAWLERVRLDKRRKHERIDPDRASSNTFFG